MYRQLRRFSNAERHLKRALAIREKTLEPTSYYTALTFRPLGDMHRQEGKCAEAKAMYQRAMKQWDASGRPHDADWAETARAYAELLRLLGRSAEATALEAKIQPTS